MSYTITEHTRNDLRIAEYSSPEILIHTADDATDILGSAWFEGYYALVIPFSLITPEFFNLKNRLAGDILQKFTNYRLRLAITGDFSHFTSESVRDFIRESNRTGFIIFPENTEAAIEELAANQK